MDTTKQTQLRKYKLLATSLFILMALGYILSSYLINQSPKAYLYYIRAFCEAGMVGALADWFAVTAIFKKPLGLAIPHTNLIENSKDEIGENLGQFVQDNFLNAQNIKPYIKQFNAVKFILNWINIDKNKISLQTEIKNFIQHILEDLDEKTLKKHINSKAKDIIKDFKIQEPAFNAADYLIENNSHNKLIDKVLPYVKKYVANSKELVKDKIDEKGGFFGSLFSNRLSGGMVTGVTEFIDEILKNPKHKVRLEIEYEILQVIDKLKNDESFVLKLENYKNDYFKDSQIEKFVDDAWQTIKEKIMLQINQPNSVLDKYIIKYSDQFVDQLNTDETLKRKINSWVRTFLFKIISKNTEYVSKLISNTVKNWDGKELSQKLELEVGKDLQFIRVNGTLIGGIIGIIIYTLTTFFLK